jgi:hypothetical protein
LLSQADGFSLGPGALIKGEFGIMLEVEFVSQRDDDIPSEIQQMGCGVASTMMLLKYHCDPTNIPIFIDLCNELQINDPPHLKGYEGDVFVAGAYAEDVLAYLARQGLRFRAWFDYPSLQERIKYGPIIVEFGPNTDLGSKEGHWVVLIEVTGRKVVFLDPSYKTRAGRSRYQREVSRGEFMRDWSKNAIQIVG